MLKITRELQGRSLGRWHFAEDGTFVHPDIPEEGGCYVILVDGCDYALGVGEASNAKKRFAGHRRYFKLNRTGQNPRTTLGEQRQQEAYLAVRGSGDVWWFPCDGGKYEREVMEGFLGYQFPSLTAERLGQLSEEDFEFLLGSLT